MFYDLCYSSDCSLMLHQRSLHKLIFCFTTVKFVCYCRLLYSASTSTSLLCSFVRCADIKYEFKKKLLKKVNTARY